MSTAKRSLHYQTVGTFNDAPRCGRPVRYAGTFELKLTGFYCQSTPLPGCGRWTLRWAQLYLAAHPEHLDACPSKSTIHRILKKNKLKPHQSRYFLNITDPHFFPKMEHLVSLYMNPPPNLFFFDECPGIQILKRLAPDLRSEHMMKRLEEFEYIRNGTMDVLAFLSQTDGEIYAECQADHKTETFLSVFKRHVACYSATEQLDYVMDNLSTHTTYLFGQTVAQLSALSGPPESALDTLEKRVAWLTSTEKRIVIHFTPYHGSWLNLIEHWFGIMNQKVLGELFHSAENLQRAFKAFVQNWNDLLAHPFRWSYDGKGLHEKAVKRFIQMLENSAAELEISMLTKQLCLMKNLLDDYATEISKEVQQTLIHMLQIQYVVLEELIQNEPGPVRKVKAANALSAMTPYVLTGAGSKNDERQAA